MVVARFFIAINACVNMCLLIVYKETLRTKLSFAISHMHSERHSLLDLKVLLLYTSLIDLTKKGPRIA
jgi:hypothetical protein